MLELFLTQDARIEEAERDCEAVAPDGYVVVRNDEPLGQRALVTKGDSLRVAMAISAMPPPGENELRTSAEAVATAPRGFEVEVNGQRRGPRVHVAAGDVLVLVKLEPVDELEFAREVEGLPMGGIFDVSRDGDGYRTVVTGRSEGLRGHQRLIAASEALGIKEAAESLGKNAARDIRAELAPVLATLHKRDRDLNRTLTVMRWQLRIVYAAGISYVLYWMTST